MLAVLSIVAAVLSGRDSLLGILALAAGDLTAIADGMAFVTFYPPASAA